MEHIGLADPGVLGDGVDGDGIVTVFRKQRMNEKVEVRRARDAMRRCIAEGHHAEDD